MSSSRIFNLLFSCCLLVLVTSSPVLPRDYSASSYAPKYNQQCPSSLIRSASKGINTDEANYVSARKSNADASLGKWLQAINSQLKLDSNTSFTTSGKLPTLALTSSGGGWRALLNGAGVISGLDSRENKDTVSGMSGLYQAFTYHSGLSGGSWLLSSIIGNGWQTVSWLKSNLWENGFNHELLTPDGLKHPFKTARTLDKIHDANKARKAAKEANGQNGTSLTDLWGRLLSYELFSPSTGGAIEQTLSAIADTGANTPWRSHSVPFPLITSIGVDYPETCLPNATATQYEFSPYEFGSWDTGVAAFTPTKYLGTSMDNGNPVKGCTTSYDNLGFVLGTSSTLFNEICEERQTTTSAILKDLLKLWSTVNGGSLETRENYATYPNPFHGVSQSTSVSSDLELTLADGGESYQNDPIWPLLHRQDVSVIIANDNSADTNDHWTSGFAIYRTLQNAQKLGLNRMPLVPTVFNDSKTSVRDPAFFGCHNSAAIMIIYVPNQQWLDSSIINANQTTMKQTYTPKETDNMIANGKLNAAQGANNQDWPVCVACATMKNFQTFAGTLKETCQACFQKYCYNPPGTNSL